MFSFLAQGVIGEILAPVKSPGQQLHGAIEDNLNDKATRLIKEEQVDVNIRDPTRDNAVPLHTAAKAGNQYMVDFLFELGAQLQVKDGSGNSPLHYAAKAGKVDLVKYLVSKGADVSSRNSHRHTPYDVATNHIIRQYLLPLQLRAEPEPEPNGLKAVHNPDAVRDYSNLPPPPTSFQPQAYAAPTHYALPKQSAWTDTSVIRPIAADGFHSSAGDPALAAKYGHTKQEINIAPPPARPSGQPAPPPPPQLSAFAGGRPMARYVAYDAHADAAVPAPVPSWQTPPPQQPQQTPGGIMYSNSPPPMPPQNPTMAPIAMPQTRPHSISPTHAQFPGAPPAPPQPMAAGPPQVPLMPTPQQYNYMQPPPQQYAQQPQQPQQQAQPFQPIRVPQAPTSGGVPTLPSPNRISVFQPAWSDNGDDAVPLT